ncbi:ATP-binding protein [Cupriavidus metallidurans]|uniref:ATP-binding protein n=1 Tax=Cupriavidus metallidurans TaxID=119219 RepID=UPI003D02A939
MRIQHAFRLITIAMVATIVGFGSYLWVGEWRAYVAAQHSEAMLQAFRATLIAAEKVSAERGPSNAALGAAPGDVATALLRARKQSDVSLGAAIAMLHGTDCSECGAAEGNLEHARAQLATARSQLDRLIARPLSERNEVQLAVSGMFNIVDDILRAADGPLSRLQRSAPVAAQHAVSARFAAELREYAGRAGSEFTSALVNNRPMRSEERERLAGDLGRVRTLGDQIQQRVSFQLASKPGLRDADAVLRKGFFGDGLAYLQKVEAIGPAEPRPTTAELASTYVPLMAPIVAMRDAVLDVAQAEVQADTTRAKKRLGGLVVILAIITSFVAATFWLFAKRVLRPLTLATEATIALAEGRYDEPTQVWPKTDEIGAIFVALEQLRANLLRKVALEHERTTLIARLQAAVMHERAQMIALAQARDAAEASARTKSSFLAMMSHEIRTPLQGILGLLELVEYSPLSAEQRRQVRLASEAGQALRQILDDVLDYAKMDAGRLRLALAPLDLRALFASVLSLLAQRAQAKGLQLQQWVQPDVPVQLVADGARLRQILLNLVGNAIKFTERGSVDLCASVEATNAGEGVLVISVADTGIGIAPEDIARLFTPFVQGESGPARRFDGSGLGLTISRQLSQLMGGELMLDSTLGVGTRVTLRVPMPACPDAGSPLSNSERPEHHADFRLV